MAENKWHEMSANERQVYDLIKQDPYISQQDLANKLNRSRPAVANLISGMIKKGYIKGKAYVLNEPQTIVCIGGANVDRKFYGKGPLQQGTSNPVRSTQNSGGVARNIAENLGRLGQNVSLLTAAGGDADWKAIEHDSGPYMNLENVAHLSNANTGNYTAVLDETGEMAVAFADMEVYDELTPDWLDAHKSLIINAGCIIADLNCPQDTLKALIQMAKHQSVPLILICVSAPKMKRLPADLSGVTWLIANQDESEVFFNESISDNTDWERIIHHWLATGLEHVVVTRGKQGAMLGAHNEATQYVPAVSPERIVDVTGSGDAFSSALIYAWIKDNTLKNIGKAGTVNATKTLESAHTVRPDLTQTQLKTDMEAF